MISRTLRTVAIAAACGMVIMAAPAMASAQSGASELPGPTVRDPLADFTEPGASMPLSNQTTITRWATSNDSYPIRTAPSSAGATITKLRYLTEDGVPEVYLVLAAVVDSAGDPWLQVAIPMKPNGRTGWVPADYLSNLHIVRTQLVVNRKTKRATLYKGGGKIWSAPVGVGKASTPTPAGKFWIREKLKGDNKDYGPWAFGTSAYSNLSDWPGGGVVGIHGTNEPGLIPGRPSHGCIRVRNDKISRLAQIMPVGTPVSIIN
jgi:lipoprotein-anchoring transpeptidase ErfK/SrfK